MKTKITLAAALAMGVMSFVTSCSNEVVEPATDAVMLEAEVSGIANTRAAIEGTTLPAGAEYGLYVFQDYKAVSGNIKMSANSTSTGYLLTNNSEVKVCAYYPYSEWGIEGEDLMTIYPGTTDYLHTISSDIYTKSNPKASIQLYHALARVKFNVTVATDAPGSYEVYFTELDNVYTKGSMRIGYYDGEVYGAYKSNGMVNVEPIKDYLKAGSLVSTEVLLLPQDLKYEAPKVIFTVDGEQKDISSDIVNATYDCRWESGKIYTYNITINEGARLSVSAASIEEWGEAEILEGVTAEIVKPVDGHEYVTIGGRKWATMNVGATTVAGSPSTCYGDYFAWGEVEPRYTGITFNEKDVIFAGWKAGYSRGYYNNNYYSYTPAKLDAEHDAASQVWGASWRTPTKNDFVELFKACNGSEEGVDVSNLPIGSVSTNSKGIYRCDDYDGVKGILFCDGVNKLFFPATGYISDKSVVGYNIDVCSWSSMYKTGYTAYSLGDQSLTSYFLSPICDGNRIYYGLPIRPVLNE